jgi:hypothetical protein
MTYRYHSRRSVKRLARRSRRNFIITLIVIGGLLYATITWILPNFIGGLGFVKNLTQPAQEIVTQSSENTTLAPPVLSIPYEATNTAEVSIAGFGTPDSKVKLYIDDESRQTTGVSGDGSFTFENVTLGLGTNNIYGKTVDDSGKESLPSKTIIILFDNEKPDLSVNEPEDGKTIQGGDKKVRVSGKSEPAVKVFVSDTQVIVDKNGNFSADQPLNEGDNILSIKAVDNAGNINEIQRRVIFQETQ